MSKNRRLALISVIVVAVLVFIGLFIFSIVKDKSAQPTTHVVILDNQSKYSRGLNTDVFISIEKMNYKILSLNISKLADVYHGTIRSNSFKKITNNSVTFIVDIPSMKTSWVATIGIDEKGNPLSDALIECIPKDKVIYTYNANCVDISTQNTGSVQDAGFDMAKDLPLTGQNYSINYTYNTTSGSSGYIVIITYYTPEGKQEGLDALGSLGYDVTKYTFKYVESF